VEKGNETGNSSLLHNDKVSIATLLRGALATKQSQQGDRPTGIDW